jgi:transcriptional regulator with XRE-family HTH domain
MARVAHILGKKLAAARQNLSMTQRELGDAIGGVSDETISRIERHEVAGILAKRVPKLASVLGIGLEEFKSGFCIPESREIPTGGAAAGRAGEAGLPGGLDLRRLRPARALPEFQIGIAASRRVDKLSEHPDANRPASTTDRRAFAAPVDGQCQHPKWKHGEIVIFSYDAYEREGIVPGKSYYLAFTDGSTTFKRVFPDEKDPDIFILRCWNRRKFPKDQCVHRDEIVRVARAVSKQVLVDEGDE